MLSVARCYRDVHGTDARARTCGHVEFERRDALRRVRLVATQQVRVWVPVVTKPSQNRVARCLDRDLVEPRTHLDWQPRRDPIASRDRIEPRDRELLEDDRRAFLNAEHHRDLSVRHRIDAGRSLGTREAVPAIQQQQSDGIYFDLCRVETVFCADHAEHRAAPTWTESSRARFASCASGNAVFPLKPTRTTSRSPRSHAMSCADNVAGATTQ